MIEIYDTLGFPILIGPVFILLQQIILSDEIPGLTLRFQSEPECLTYGIFTSELCYILHNPLL